MKREFLPRRDGPVVRRRSWPIFSWGCVIVLGSMYAWAFRANAGRGDPGGLWLVAAVMLATAAFLRQLGTCAVILRPETLVVLNPVGSQEVRYDAIRGVEAFPAGSLKMYTVRDESLYPVVFGGSLADLRFHTSEKAADVIRGRLPRVARSVRNSDPVKKSSVRFCWSADTFLVLAALAAIVGGVLKAVD